MNESVSGANIRLTGSATGFINALNEARKTTGVFVREINADLSGAYKNADAQQRLFRNGLTRLGNEIQDVSKKFMLFAALPTAFAAGKTFKDFADVEKLEKGLVRFGESIKNVREIAKLPNIGIFDGAKSLISLKAMKLSSDLAARSIKAFANAITEAGGSAIDLEPALINLRQFVATRNINQVDLRQLSARMPQTFDALQSAFGTQDVEKLNEKMKKIGVEAFIGKFIAELEKIPPAGAGAATAIEQLGDSATFFSATIGKGIENAFNVSDKLKAFGGILDDLSTNFEALNPDAQQAILMFGGLAIAIPIVTSAVGALIKLLPLLKAGFAGVTWPAVAALAAVTAISGLIAIMPLLTQNTANFNRQQELVSQFPKKLDPLIAKYEELKKSTGVEEQKKLKDVVKQISEQVPSAVTAWDKYGTAIDINTGKVKTYTEEQRKLLKSMQDVRRESLLAELKRSEFQQSQLQKEIQSGPKANYLGMGVYQNANAVSGFELNGNKNLLEVRKQLSELTERDIANRKELLSLGGQDIYIAEAKKLDEMKTLRKQYSEQYKEALKSENGALISSINDKAVALDKDIKGQQTKVNLMVGAWNKAKEEARGAAAATGTVVQEINDGIVESDDKVIDSGLAYKEMISKQKEELAEKLRLLEEIKKIGSGLNPLDANGISSGHALNAFSKDPENQRFQQANAGLKANETFAKLGDSSISKGLDQVNDKLKSTTSTTKGLLVDLSLEVQAAAQGIAYGFGEMFGNLMSGAGGIEHFGKRVIGSLSNMMKEMGKSLIATGTAGIALKFFAKNPYLAVAAGIGLVALGTAAQNKLNSQAEGGLTKFANSGMAYRKMVAVVGDNHNARHDPEIIAPKSMVEKTIQKAMSTAGRGGNVMIPEIRIEGTQLLILFNRAQDINYNLRGY